MLANKDKVEKLVNIIKDKEIKISYIDDELTLAYSEGLIGFAKRNKKVDKDDKNVAILVSVARLLKIDEDKVQGIVDVLFNDKENIAKQLDFQTLGKIMNEKIESSK